MINFKYEYVEQMDGLEVNNPFTIISVFLICLVDDTS